MSAQAATSVRGQRVSDEEIAEAMGVELNKNKPPVKYWEALGTTQEHVVNQVAADKQRAAGRAQLFDPEESAMPNPPKPMTVGDRVLMLSDPTIEDLVACRNYIKTQQKFDTCIGTLVKDPAFAMLSPEIQMQLAKDASREQLAGSKVETTPLEEICVRPEYVALNIWLLARHNHPELLLAEVSSLITEQNVLEISVRLSDTIDFKKAQKNLVGTLS